MFDTQAEITIQNKHSLKNDFISQERRKERGGLPPTPTQNLTDQITLFQPGGAEYYPTLLFAPPPSHFWTA